MESNPTPENKLVPATLSAQFLPVAEKKFVPPAPGEVITSFRTQNTYTIGSSIGEGNFGMVYACTDTWNNDLAVKVLKPRGLPYDKIKAAAEAEFVKLVALRHPSITYIYDAFEYRDTFYIVTERCLGPVSGLFTLPNFDGQQWIMPIARCLLQAVHFLHINGLVHQDIHLGNVFTTFIKDEMPTDDKAIQFKLADMGVARLFQEVDGQNTRNNLILPPEVLRPAEFGPMDYHIDIYHVGLLLLQLANSKELNFTEPEILAGKPREMAEALATRLRRKHIESEVCTGMSTSLATLALCVREGRSSPEIAALGISPGFETLSRQELGRRWNETQSLVRAGDPMEPFFRTRKRVLEGVLNSQRPH